MEKLVNGVLVPMTDAEIAQRRAEEAVWASRHIPTIDEIDQAELNAALLAQGSVIRAIIELTFQEINKLRVKTGDLAYTKAQFVAALKAKMRG